MYNDLFVDGLNALTEWGIGVQDEGYAALVEFQSLRTPPVNNFPDTNGIEVDLSDPKLHNKVFSLTLHGIRDRSIRDFIDYLDENTYHSFEFRNIGLTSVLRLDSMPDRRTVQNAKVFNLDFADDTYPFDTYTRPTLIDVPDCPQTGIDIDNIPLSDYGIWYTDGERDEILVVGDVKNALTIDDSHLNSVLYDSKDDVRYDSRDITINMALWAPKEVFWNNWNAFFYDLTRPGLRELYYNVREDTYNTFYKSCKVNRFQRLPNDKLYCNFQVTFTFTSMHLTDEWNLLAVEQYGLVKLDNTDLMVDTSIKPDKNPS